jgi:glycine/D-amino acid oxidase-like deaminating enzyme
MEAEAAVELEPQAVSAVFPEGMGVIAYFPEESWVEAAALARLLGLAARRHGAQLHFGAGLAGIEISGGGVKGISLKGGERLEADAVVNACGPGAAEIADMVGSPLGLDLRSGLLVTVAVEEVPVSRMLHADRVNLRPDSTGGLLLHHESADRRYARPASGTPAGGGDLLRGATPGTERFSTLQISPELARPLAFAPAGERIHSPFGVISHAVARDILPSIILGEVRQHAGQYKGGERGLLGALSAND